MIIAQLKKEGRADLSDLSMQLAVRVAAQVIGLTNSIVSGMERRLNGFFQEAEGLSWTPSRLYRFLHTQLSLLTFFLFDV